MRVLAAALLLLIALTFIPNTYVTYSENVIPHINPEELSEEVNTYWLLLIYVGIFNELIKMNFTNVSIALQILNQTTLPKDLLYIFNRVNELINSTKEGIKTAKEHLDNATVLYSQGFYEHAFIECKKSAFYISKTNITINELKGALNELLKRLPVIPILREEIISLKSKLRDLIDELEELLKELLDEVLSLIELSQEEKLRYATVETKILIYVKPNPAVLGSFVNVYGFLLMINNTAIPNSSVKIFIEGIKSFKVLTDKKGFFNITFKLPYIYVGYITVKAIYIPYGKHAEVFKPCFNQTLLYLIYNKTKVLVEAPQYVYSTIPFNITIKVFPPSNRSFSLYINDNLFLSDMTYTNGTYVTSLVINSTKLKHKISVFVKPYKLFGPAYGEVYVELKFKPLETFIRIPSIILTPFKHEVSGFVMSEGSPVVNATVEVIFLNNIFKSKTSEEGFFSIFIEGFSYNIISYEKLIVRIKPLEPWIEKKELTYTTLVINVITSSITTFSVVALIASILIILRKEKEVITITRKPAKLELQKEVKEIVGVKEIVIIEFIKFLNVLAKIVGVNIRKEETLREYLSKVKTRISKRLWKYIEEIFFIIEKHLYSPVKIKAPSAVNSFIKKVRVVISELFEK